MILLYYYMMFELKIIPYPSAILQGHIAVILC